MTVTPPVQPRQRIRVFLSSAPLLSLVSVRKAGALAAAELGVAAFFVMGVVPAPDSSGPWFVLAACLIAAFVRAIDIESWALFLPDGLIGRAEHAFGPRMARVAAACTIGERLLLAALACIVAGHYIADVPVIAVVGPRLAGRLTAEELSTVLAAILIGLLWIRARLGVDLSREAIAKGVWIGIGVLVVLAGWAVFTLIFTREPASLIAFRGLIDSLPAPAQNNVLAYLTGLALALPAIGGGEALTREAHSLPPPRVRALKRTAMLVTLFAFLAIAVPTFSFALLVPGNEQTVWRDAPLAGLVRHLAGSAFVRSIGTLLLDAAVLLTLVPAAHAALADVEQTLRRLSASRVLPEGLAALHPRFGTPARAVDVAAAATVMVMVISSGRVAWLSRAYAVGIAATLVVKMASLLRCRTTRSGALPFKAPGNVRVAGRELPVGLVITGATVAAAASAMLLTGDLPSIAAISLVAGLVVLLTTTRQPVDLAGNQEALDAFELLAPADLSLGHVDARPGNLLVPVRNPYSLAHVAAALRAPGDRDVIVMTVRLVDDPAGDVSASAEPTAAERQLFSRVVALAERQSRPVRLLIVPGSNVFDAVVATVVRLRSSEIHVGESASLSADEQARLLGEAWERTLKPDALEVRLVIHHPSGRTDAYYLGAHPPAFTPGDLDLIHRVWLDAVKAVGAHVHHHDVVRAALTQMEQQLGGPQRDEALAAIRQVARPADELAAVLRARDYSRLRDMLRNRHASELATVLTELNLEDQVLAFRVLPRKDAAAVFEYLSQEDKESLLKAMAQEDVAALLNNMAPDDRTMFLEELPAAATRQLLALLTPAERSVALTLLGYPERSVGRLMTPQYVAVREDWTVREVLDYVREHGHDSETLNVIYVVDEQALLLDDIRIREFLLTSLDHRVSDLMDRRFVALKASDDQEAAVSVFRQYDRTALPVTDTGGMLIGIVTIDDVLDVAEAAATREIHKIGGSEALDEPYMQIGLGRMIQKRAGWLTALFLGELLTATAMGAFEAEISRAVVLALFVPLIISSGGNSGSQASTLVIRALALGEVGLADWWRVMRREIFAGLSLGSILGSVGFLRITLWSAFSDIYGPHWLLVAITVAVALVGIVLWGTLIGSLLPFLLRRIGFDPATSSAPFVATLVDVTGLVIYFSVAMVILRGTLL
jgi:magnesium transporter